MAATNKYKSIGEEIQAIQWLGSNALEIKVFTGSNLEVSVPPSGMEINQVIPNEGYIITVPTSEGNMKIARLNWVIKHSDGAISVCSDRLFKSVYMEVKEAKKRYGKYKPTLVFDFDGVINSYASGWKGATVIPDEPVEGIKELIANLRKDYIVAVQSTRCFSPGGIKAIEDYLAKYGIKVDIVTAEKPPAVLYLDDRAWRFHGTTEGLEEEIRANTKNWIDIKKKGGK